MVNAHGGTESGTESGIEGGTDSGADSGDGGDGGDGGHRAGRLLAVSDLHVGMRENRPIVEALRPQSADDWLIVAGDVGELFADIEWALRLLSERFATVVWVPGNHELWTHPRDPITLRGQERYNRL
jgi:hypothetical protein